MFRIKKVQPDEIRELSVLASDILKEHYDPIIGPEQNDYMLEMFQTAESIAGQIEHGYRYYWAVYNGEKAGFFAIIPRDGSMYLSKLYIKKERRGLHMARPIIDFIAKEMKKERLKSIFLNVNKRNYDSIEIYKHLGFSVIREEKNDIGNGYFMDDYVMEYPAEV